MCAIYCMVISIHLYIYASRELDVIDSGVITGVIVII